MPIATETAELFRAHFDALMRESPGPAWLAAIRRRAMDCYTELGLPSPKNESWKHTNVAPLKRVPFRAARAGHRAVDAERIDRVAIEGLAGPRLVFVDGAYAANLSRGEATGNGLCVESLAAALRSDRGPLETHLAGHAGFTTRAFTALNTALFTDGAWIHLAKGGVCEEPIHLVFAWTASGAPVAGHPRVLVVAEDLSQMTVIEEHLALGSEPYLSNSVVEIVVGAGATVDHLKLQREGLSAFHFSTLQTDLSRDSRLSSTTIHIGGRLVRTDVQAWLNGENIECDFNGLYVTDGDQHVDTDMKIEHAKPHCVSHELFKGILDGSSSGAFRGLIHVHPDAQKTDAYQTNQNLLLSGKATAYSDPQLEIYADDVKCSHGSTTGQLDDTALFYLRSRGISRDGARGILVDAFASEVVDRISVPAARETARREIRRCLSSSRT